VKKTYAKNMGYIKYFILLIFMFNINVFSLEKNDIKVILFDTFGTVVDWRTSIIKIV
jgi:hypothetical protein